VAGVFDALTTERPYKQAWSPERARQHLIESAGAHFDPAVVTAFLSRWPQVEADLHLRTANQAVPAAA
jgi:putative two-component system response regulator